MKKLGLIVNPIAGIGGRVGLKGSDGKAVQQEAWKLGAKAEASIRTAIALKEILPICHKIKLFTAPFDMGEESAKLAGFCPKIIGCIRKNSTTSSDTISIAKQMQAIGMDLIVFAGGDGTACNIYQAIRDTVPVIGIPAGVKIHSAVFAINPKSAGRAIFDILNKKNVDYMLAEVMDIDEEAFRKEKLNVKLKGYLKIPVIKNYMQPVKSGGYSEKGDLFGITAEIIEKMKKGVYYVIGPGTTTRFINKEMGLEGSLLGVDVIRDKKLVAIDVNEKDLFKLLNGKDSCIILTVIGGQGHVFGRGNQQISPRIIRMVGKNNIIIIATKKKLFSIGLNPLLLDTGDEELNRSLSGWVRVITGYKEAVMCRLEA